MNQNKNINRRHFLKALGTSTAIGAAALTGCSLNKSSDLSPKGSHTGEVPKGKMTYRSFPNLGGDKVSLLGYGCMRWPTIQGPKGKDIIDQETVNELIDYALAHGVNYFDTSPVYVQGLSEEATGIALHRHPRESYYVATKLSNFAPVHQTHEASVAMYRDSMKRLQVDYIDYYLLHSIGGDRANWNSRYIDNGMLKFLQRERTAGRIRHLGFSFHGDANEFDYVLSLHDSGEAIWDFVQIQMNYVDWRHPVGAAKPAEYLYNELEKRQIPVVIMEPLLGGRLVKIPTHLISTLKQRKPEDSVASWAFRFLGSHPMVLTCLSGMTYMEDLQDNIRTMSPLMTLNNEETDFLYQVADMMMEYPTVPCNSCQYCMPCPYGINIPGIFEHYNKCINEGYVPDSSKDPNYAKARQAFLIGYDRKVPKLRQASHCIQCGQCSPHCPQRINIPADLERIDKFVEQLKQGTL